jgi:hypothetical protein
MSRRSILGFLALLCFVGLTLGDETYVGRVKKVDKDQITLKASKGDVVVTVDKNTKYMADQGTFLAYGIRNVRPPSDAKITTVRKDGKEVASKVVIIIPIIKD